jgi:hypothetical protein
MATYRVRENDNKYEVYAVDKPGEVVGTHETLSAALTEARKNNDK